MPGPGSASTLPPLRHLQADVIRVCVCVFWPLHGLLCLFHLFKPSTVMVPSKYSLSA